MIRIVYYLDEDGKDRVRITGGNGEPMLGSEAYEQRQSAQHMIEVVAEAFATGDYEVVSPVPSPEG
jgi:uncharacterized protein YegP (UPF0339 family)